MRLALPLCGLLVALSLAGCLGGLDDDGGPTAATVDTPRLSTDQTEASGTQALVWDGATLRGERLGTGLVSYDHDVVCGEANCERVPFTLALPDGYWDAHDGALEITVQVEEDDWARLHLTIEDASGAVVASGQWATYAATVMLEEAPPGDYVAVVAASAGEGPYRGVVQLEAGPVDHGPARELLPNLVMLAPQDIHIPDTAVSAFGPGVPPSAVTDTAGVRGCDAWELVEKQARTCLRFTTSVGNLGEGFLEVRLTFEEGAKALAQEGRFVQRIHATDGTHEDVPVDGAAFHPTHAHFHYEDLAVFKLHRYDLDTRTRGEEVSATGKSGFCFYDMGLVMLDQYGTTHPRFDDEANCFLSPEDDWVTGVSPGWFDRYWSSLSDQYVEITGLEDGVYELVVSANGGGTLVEETTADNAAGAVLELEGDEVTVLWTWADYLGGPGA